MTPIPSPHFTAEELPGQVRQLQRALQRLIDELNFILPMLEKGEEKGNSL